MCLFFSLVDGNFTPSLTLTTPQVTLNLPDSVVTRETSFNISSLKGAVGTPQGRRWSGTHSVSEELASFVRQVPK